MTHRTDPRFTAEPLSWSHRGDGHHGVVRLSLGGGQAVLKLFGRKRGLLRSLIRRAGSWLIGKSSMTPRGRLGTEREVLQLWRQHGFDVPAVLAPAPEESFPLPFLLMEALEGPTLGKYLQSSTIALEEKRRAIARLARDFGKRHALAVQLKDPRLIHLHPSLDHVIWHGQRMVIIDFEVVYLPVHRAEHLLSLEILTLLRSLGKLCPELFDLLLEEFVRAYPHPDFLQRLELELKSGSLWWTRLLNRVGIWWDARKALGKSSILRALNRSLAAVLSSRHSSAGSTEPAEDRVTQPANPHGAS